MDLMHSKLPLHKVEVVQKYLYKIYKMTPILAKNVTDLHENCPIYTL